MITIKTLSWDNWFSYGEGNNLSLDDAKVCQINGTNGSGKSSIPVILGEVLYGKNAFGKVKQKLFNRYLDKPVLNARLVFDKDGKEYIVDYSRKSTLKMTLLEDGIDISSHSATNTLKTLNDILGFEFKLFWQLIYQSSTTGLEFLTATDTNRKKFLINLFNLDKYLEIHDQFKKIGSEISNELLSNKAKLSTIQGWIEKHEKEDLIEKVLEPVPSVAKSDIETLTNLKVKLHSIDDTNRKINNNNEYKKLLKNLDTEILSEQIHLPDITGLSQRKNELIKLITEKNTRIVLLNNSINKIKNLNNTCPECTQEVPTYFKENYINIHNTDINALIKEIEELNVEIKNIDNKLNEYRAIKLKLDKVNKVSLDLQDLLSKIDTNLPEEIIDKNQLLKDISDLQDNINNVNSAIKLITVRNSAIEAHNSKVKVIKNQLKEYKEALDKLQYDVNDNDFTLNKINIIKKAFSTNGLLNYKIEYLVKDLEYQINTYLEDLSNGRFQLLFALNDEKLDIEIIDDSKTISIEELSAGELARINTSTLLAIRKLMAAISSTKLNVLFLDEIMGVLDDEGKEKLIEILNQETELNTFLVSHEFSHPLIPKINIIKNNKISRIENG